MRAGQRKFRALIVMKVAARIDAQRHSDSPDPDSSDESLESRRQSDALSQVYRLRG